MREQFLKDLLWYKMFCADDRPFDQDNAHEGSLHLTVRQMNLTRNYHISLAK